MKKFRFYFSLLFAKLSYLFLKVTKLTSGTSIIGLITLKLCPNFLNHANEYITKSKINITGTNGKTTTSGIITHLIRKDKKSVINNSMGANMLNGIVNAFALQINPLKKADFSVTETDEAFLEIVNKDFDSDYLLVTNLFRDQLDRYGELTTTKRFIQNGIDLKPDLQLILNADDPLVASFKYQNKTPIFYGVENVVYKDGLEHLPSKAEEAFNCPCGKALEYSKKFYAQQGHYHCDCGYTRPDVKYKADVTLYKTHCVLNINNEEFDIPLVGLFNAYNALGAIALAKELGIKNIQENLKTFKVAFGRSEVKFLNGKRTLIQLIKNPAGASEVLKTIDLDTNLLIIINDNYADGRDVSWLWDTDFECINKIHKEIILSGTRANDMALRLKYADVDTNKLKIISNIKEAVDYVGKVADNDITILPTYTALLKLNKMKIIKNR